MRKLELPLEFEWDNGNEDKNLVKHGITNEEAEQTFFNFNVALVDEAHSQKEERYQLIGESLSGKILFIVFTERSDKVRIISVRTANHKERKIYEKAKENSTI